MSLRIPLAGFAIPFLKMINSMLKALDLSEGFRYNIVFCIFISGFLSSVMTATSITAKGISTAAR